MNAIFIGLLLLQIFKSCTPFRATPLMHFDVKSSDASTALKQAAQVLNVPTPANWPTYMHEPLTRGTTGHDLIGIDTVDTTISTWSIPNEFHNEVVKRIKLLLFAATEGSYTVQVLVFDIPSGAFLTTLLIVVKKLELPIDPHLPVEVAYMTIQSNANIKQQYTPYAEPVCHRCWKKLKLGRCCHDETRYAPRGNTMEEILIIKQKLTSDQFTWFSEQPLIKINKKYGLLQNKTNEQTISLTEAIKRFLLSNIAKTEVMAPYNDSILSALQSNMESLKLSSQLLKMTKVESQNLFMVLSAFASDYGFESIIISPSFPEQLQSGRFSHEYLFTTSTDSYDKDIAIKYILVLGQSIDNSTFTINFLHMKITSEEIINILLSNETNTDGIGYHVFHDKEIKVARASILNDNGDFLNEYISVWMSSWQLKTTKTAMNILRFVTASALLPQKYRMLSSFDPEVILPEMNNSIIYRSPLKVTPATIIVLAEVVSSVAKAWKDIASAFKSKTTTTMTQIVRFGFTYFAQKSTILKVTDLPAERVTEFTKELIVDYNLPTQGSFALGLKYSADFTWDCSEFLYSPEKNGNYRSLTLLKTGNSLTNTATFIIIDINADWKMAPDLLLIQTSTSRWGGLFENDKQSIQEIPHTLTIDEIIKLQQFFQIVALGKLGPVLGLNIPFPSLN